MSETLVAQPYDLLAKSIGDDEESTDMGSFNHSSVQANLAFLLKRLGQYRVSTELSLDVSRAQLQPLKIKDELKPDVCLYPKRGLSRPFDILKMTEMPQLAVEILSPRQGTEEILLKFAVFTRTSFIPSSTHLVANPFPMPLAAPVITATRSLT